MARFPFFVSIALTLSYRNRLYSRRDNFALLTKREPSNERLATRSLAVLDADRCDDCASFAFDELRQMGLCGLADGAD